jgi:hypothetical protein
MSDFSSPSSVQHARWELAPTLGLLALYLSVLGRGLVPSVAAAVIVSFLVFVTFDLDRPTRGLLQIRPHRFWPRRRP